MSAFTTLQLKNQAATEVSYSPADIDPSTGVAKWLGAGASYDARPQVTLSVSYPKGNSSKVKVRGKISVPIMDPMTATNKSDELIGTFELALPKVSTLLERQNLRASLTDFLADSVVVAAVENFESVY